MRTFIIAVIILSVSKVVCSLIKKSADRDIDKFVREFQRRNK